MFRKNIIGGLRRQSAWLAVTFLAAGFIPKATIAQIISPSQVTPPSLRPDDSVDASVSLPESQSLDAPAGAETIQATISSVAIAGGFREMASAEARVAAALIGRDVTVADIYRVANELEQSYAAAGYVLARVVVAPQQLAKGGVLKLVVVDGYIEAIDTEALPKQARKVVAARLAGLIGQRQLRLAEIERRLLIAATVPGLRLRSTLVRGADQGGTKLVIDGSHQPVSGSFGTDNRLPDALGGWQFNAAVSLNSPFGFGEQIYGLAATGYDLGHAFDGRSPIEIFGGGVVLPLGTDGFTLNPEYTHSRTRPKPAAGAPQSEGAFVRFALRARYPLILNRLQSLMLQASIEHVIEHLTATGFDTDLSRDRYGAARFEGNWSARLPRGQMLEMNAAYSHGLGGRSEADAALSGIPLSRQFATPKFDKLNLSLRLLQPLPRAFDLTLIARAQTSFHKALLRSEQFSLDGLDAVSSTSAGSFSTDEGVTLRSELSRRIELAAGQNNLALTPYIFAAAGRGYVRKPTAVEARSIDAASLGLGLRGGSDRTGPFAVGSYFALEAARQFSDLPHVRDDYRINVNFGVRL